MDSRVVMLSMPQNRQLETLFLREKPARILLGLKTAKEGKVYATVLSRETNCTYSHTIKILNLFQKLNLVKFDKAGRIKHVALTEDGLDIAHNLEAMVKKFVQIEDMEAKPASKQIPVKS